MPGSSAHRWSLTASSSLIGPPGPAGRVPPVREQPEQQAPPVQRLRLRYAKRGRLRFTSHRDFCRAFERALFRARVPMAYSSGFNPHPRISYAGASPTGAASEAEYLEIGLAEATTRRACTPRSTTRCPPGWTSSRSWCRRAGRSPTGSRPASGGPGSWAGAAAEARGGPRVAGRRRGAGRADDEEGAAHLRLPRRGRVSLTSADAAGRRGRVCDTRHGFAARNPVRETRRRPRRTAHAGRARGRCRSLHERLAQGPLDAETGTVGDPLALNRDTA